MFWNLEVITSTGKSLCIITQIQFNIIYIMRTNINQGRIQPLAVMIVLLINNCTPHILLNTILGLTDGATSTHWFQLPSPRSPENLSVMKSSRYPVLPESFWQSHSGFHASALAEISAPLLSPENVADKFYRLPFFLPLDALSPIASLRSLMCIPAPPNTGNAEMMS